MPRLIRLLPLLLALLLSTAVHASALEGGCHNVTGSSSLTVKVVEAGAGRVVVLPEYRGDVLCTPSSQLWVEARARVDLDLDQGVIRASVVFGFESRGEDVNATISMPPSEVRVEWRLEGGKGRVHYTATSPGSTVVDVKAVLGVEPRGLVLEGSLAGEGVDAFATVDVLEKLLSSLLVAPVRVEKLSRVNGSLYFTALVPADAVAEATGLPEDEALELIRSLRGGLEAYLETGRQGLRIEARADISFDPKLARRMVEERLRRMGFNASIKGRLDVSYTMIKSLSEGRVRVEASLKGPVIEAASLSEALRLAAEPVKTIAWATGYEPLLLGGKVASLLTPARVEIVYPNGTVVTVPLPDASSGGGEAAALPAGTGTGAGSVSTATATPGAGQAGATPAGPGAPAASTEEAGGAAAAAGEPATGASPAPTGPGSGAAEAAAAIAVAAAAAAAALLLARRRQG